EVRSPNKDYFGLPYLEMDISIYHGNSGGPLCNDKGEVVGVVSSMTQDGRGFAVPIAAMRPEKFGPLKDRNPNREMSSLHLEFAEQLMKASGPTDQVMMNYESALLWDSGNSSLYSKVGEMNLLTGRHPSAVAYLIRSLQMQPWPEKAETYRSLGIALLHLKKTPEAISIWKEGLDKYPLDNAQLWGEIAGVLERDRRYSEAALSARLALKTFTGRASEMNDIYKRSLTNLSPAERGSLQSIESDLDNHLGRLRAAADQARRDGKSFMNADAEKVVATMTGVQKESVSNLGRIEVGKPKTLKISDEELDIRFIRGRIEVAKEHLRNGHQEQAVEILEDVIKSYPAHPETDAARLCLRIIRRN
ncbi:MAG: trypsin-like serine protease, partial [Planctomycetaceae bacterium]|nr:trypsin-like serine protease [Planctomycetaceae bacterium]